jgi:hypothetical protein
MVPRKERSRVDDMMSLGHPRPIAVFALAIIHADDAIRRSRSLHRRARSLKGLGDAGICDSGECRLVRGDWPNFLVPFSAETER